MIGGEHKKERLSEWLVHAQNQPRNRGYLPGTQARSAGYSVGTLLGNWADERADATFYDGRATLSLRDATATTYRASYQQQQQQQQQQQRQLSASQLPPLRRSCNQATLLALEDKARSCYPGHQPLADTLRSTVHVGNDNNGSSSKAKVATRAAEGGDTMTTAAAAAPGQDASMYVTVTAATYRPPDELRAAAAAYVRPMRGGTPAAQAASVLSRLRRQLQLRMPARSAFPGNVARTLRHALAAHCPYHDPCTCCCNNNSNNSSKTMASGCVCEVNATELQAGLHAVGVDACADECVALVRYYDRNGSGVACVDALVRELRGRLSDRRELLVRHLYNFVATLCEGGVVRLRRLVELVDTTQLPRVRAGEVTALAARRAFAEQWDVPMCNDGDDDNSNGDNDACKGGDDEDVAALLRRCRDAYISRNAFLTFFGDAAFEVPCEVAYERFVRDVWHLSGGNGRAANRSCRRVEVVHTNGRVTREEIVNDLAMHCHHHTAGDVCGDAEEGGVSAELQAALRANLASQGIKDIKSLRVLPCADADV